MVFVAEDVGEEEEKVEVVDIVGEQHRVIGLANCLHGKGSERNAKS